MHLRVDPGRPVALVDPDDFTSFKVVASARSWGELERALGDTGRIDPPHVWVDPAAVRALGTSKDAAWVSGLEAMLEYAAARGWVDPSGAVRAHCEWLLGDPGPG